MEATSHLLEPKRLYRRLDSLFGSLDQSRPQPQLLKAFLRESFTALADDIQLSAALLYGERRDDFLLLDRVGEAFEPVQESLSAELPPLRLTFEHRVFIFPDPAQEGSPQSLGLLPPQPAAALTVGRRPSRYVFFFVLRPTWEREELDFTLNTLRAAFGSRLKDERVRGSFRQAAEIQRSLLPDEAPQLPGFDIGFKSLATEEVGGDFFDFLSLSDDTLGLSIGDASGHGLPAALLVRDVVTGLRMGIEKELRVAPVFSRLNKVVHRSNLSSRFVSVFYGELTVNGTLTYVNAGHQPPLLFSQRRAERLEIGGTVIGPLPRARFELGGTRMEPGSTLVLCTDGILERRDAKGEFFPEERLGSEVLARPEESSQETVERVFQTVFSFGQERPWDDDATLMVVRRLE
jgi:sigma-B regulation protein RsbU (phosphoserine phosphatase)